MVLAVLISFDEEEQLNNSITAREMNNEVKVTFSYKVYTEGTIF